MFTEIVLIFFEFGRAHENIINLITQILNYLKVAMFLKSRVITLSLSSFVYHKQHNKVVGHHLHSLI